MNDKTSPESLMSQVHEAKRGVITKNELLKMFLSDKKFTKSDEPEVLLYNKKLMIDISDVGAGRIISFLPENIDSDKDSDFILHNWKLKASVSNPDTNIKPDEMIKLIASTFDKSGIKGVSNIKLTDNSKGPRR